MMKYLAFILVLLIPLNLLSQEQIKIYNPDANAGEQLQQAIQTAAAENKHVLVQVGGNWCSWCLKLHKYFNSEAQIDSILKADYVRVFINYSPENKNREVLAELGYPQRFGFPVLLVLDQKGQRLHTQDTGLLELDKGYDPDKIKRFLLEWNVSALDPEKYKK